MTPMFLLISKSQYNVNSTMLMFGKFNITMCSIKADGSVICFLGIWS